MNWADISKEKKQALILIGMWVLGGVFALYQFVLMPFIRSRGASSTELDDLKTKIQKAEVAMEGDSRLRREYAEMTGKLLEASDRYIVPIENPLSWVTEKVYSTARGVGVDIQTVMEMMSASPGWDQLVKSERTFRPYAVRIVTEGSYADVRRFIDALEKGNPYLYVSGISIVSQDQQVTRHSVSLTVEWPMWGRRLEIGQATKKAAAGAEEGGDAGGKPAAEM